jgi:hypothetical protein
MPAVLAAPEMLTNAAAHIATLQAINRHVKRALNTDRKTPH